MSSMTDKFPDLTPRQLRAFKEIERIKMEDQRTKMAWVILSVLLGVVVALSTVVIVMICLDRHWAATTGVGLLDAIFARSISQIVAHHWPKPNGTQQLEPVIKPEAS